MHHGPMDKTFEEEIRKSMGDLGLGATKSFPEGKLTAGDEGEIKLAVTHHKGKVVISFGKEVAWFGMSPQQAIDFANKIKARALLARK